MERSPLRKRDSVDDEVFSRVEWDMLLGEREGREYGVSENEGVRSVWYSGGARSLSKETTPPAEGRENDPI